MIPGVKHAPSVGSYIVDHSFGYCIALLIQSNSVAVAFVVQSIKFSVCKIWCKS